MHYLKRVEIVLHDIITLEFPFKFHTQTNTAKGDFLDPSNKTELGPQTLKRHVKFQFALSILRALLQDYIVGMAK